MSFQLEPEVESVAAPKFCRNCVHLRVGEDWQYAKCAYEFPGEVNLVTGAPLMQQYTFCSSLRNSSDPRCCGPVGRFFEERTFT